MSERKGETNVNDLKAFVAIVEQGSFSKAAAYLNISQPTASVRLQSLEDHLRVRLIDRKQGVALTEMGSALYNRTRQLLTQIETFEAAAHELESLQKGHLRIGFSTPPFAMTLIGAFRKANPGVQLSISQSQTWGLMEALKNNKIDAAILTLPELPTPEWPSNAFNHILVARQKLACLVPMGHPLVKSKVVEWEQIITEPLLVRKKPSMTYTQVATEISQRELTLNPFLELPTREAIKDAVICGLGVGLVFASEAGEDRRLVTLDIKDAAEASGIYVVTLADTKGLPAIVALLAIAEQYAQDGIA